MVRRGGHPTVAAGLLDALRQDVLSGRLAPGQRLKVAEVAAARGVSQTVVREALVALVGMGLVTNEPQVGFRVATLSIDHLLDLTSVRVEVEALALRRAVRDGDLDWEADVVAAHHVLASTPMIVGGALSEQWADHHRRFHRTLVAGCGSPTLLEIRQRLYERSELYRWWSAGPGEHRGRDVAEEHAGLVAAVLARDADLAVARMTAHIETTTSVLLTSRQPAVGDARPPTR